MRLLRFFACLGWILWIPVVLGAGEASAVGDGRYELYIAYSAPNGKQYHQFFRSSRDFRVVPAKWGTGLAIEVTKYPNFAQIQFLPYGFRMLHPAIFSDPYCTWETLSDPNGELLQIFFRPDGTLRPALIPLYETYFEDLARRSAGIFDTENEVAAMDPARPNSCGGGGFRIYELEYNADGSLHRFGADFKYVGGGAKLVRGFVLYNASRPVAPPNWRRNRYYPRLAPPPSFNRTHGRVALVVRSDRSFFQRDQNRNRQEISDKIDLKEPLKIEPPKAKVPPAVEKPPPQTKDSRPRPDAEIRPSNSSKTPLKKNLDGSGGASTPPDIPPSVAEAQTIPPGPSPVNRASAQPAADPASGTSQNLNGSEPPTSPVNHDGDPRNAPPATTPIGTKAESQRILPTRQPSVSVPLFSLPVPATEHKQPLHGPATATETVRARPVATADNAPTSGQSSLPALQPSNTRSFIPPAPNRRDPVTFPDDAGERPESARLDDFIAKTLAAFANLLASIWSAMADFVTA